MSDRFSDWITAKLDPLGWKPITTASSNLFSSIRFKPQNTMQPFSVIYLKARIDTDGLRYLFQNIPDYLLIVVDGDEINDQVGLKEWFRALHALYYGRVYVWDGVGILPVHYDRHDGQFSNGRYVQLRSLRFECIDCLYGGFKGLYNVVLLNDRKFWTTAEKPPSREKTTPNEEFWQAQHQQTEARGSAKTDARKQEHFRREQAQRDEHKRRADAEREKREREDVFRDFNEAFERNKRRYDAENGSAYDPNARPQYTRGGVQGDKWFIQIWSDGTKDGAKKVYRALGLKYHPDVNKAPDATTIMQAINQAYEKVMEIHERT